MKRKIRVDKMVEFASAYEENRELMFRLAYSIVHNDADADDAMSEAVLKAWVNIDKLRDKRALSRWLIRIVINTAKNVNHRKKKEYITDDMYVFEKLQEEEENTGTDMRIWKALERIDKKYSTVIIMRYYNDMTVLEIANALHMQEGIRNGSLMFKADKIYDINELLYSNALFDGNAAYIGYPSDNGIPVSKSEYNSLVNNYINIEGQNNYNNILLEKSTVGDFDIISDIIGRATFSNNNESVVSVLKEDVQKYFDGTRTLEETIDIIQDKMTKYVNENM